MSKQAKLNRISILENKKEWTGFQRLILRRFHPQAIFIDVSAGMWAVYLFWHHQWLAALAVVLTARFVGTVLAWNMDYEAFAKTTLGRLGLLHLHPANLFIQMLSIFPLLYGIWVHESIPILGGLSLLFLGHLFGWKKVILGV